MKPNQKLSSAIAALLSVHATAAYAREVNSASATSESTESIAEVIVTAQRRSENIQDVPMTIQALTAEMLDQLNVRTVDDFIKYLPNVSRSTNGPGQGEIYMRGLAVGAEGTTGTFPNVAIYLDDQAAQLPGRNLDIYAIDLERIEVLEGPQGTLFGGSAEAGVLRYITNKPKLDVTEGSLDAGYGTTAHGNPNSNVAGVINLPLIANTLAVRGVFYNDRHGGYINNVPSDFVRKGTDLGLAERNGGTVNSAGVVLTPGHVPADSVVINNNNIASHGINPVSYTGFRLSSLYKISDDWDALLTQLYQNIDAEGVFYQNPKGSEGNRLPRLSVTLFNPSFNTDKVENTALVVNGKIGDLKLVYSGAYLVRHAEQVQDYTNYARGVFGTYYQCTGYSTGFDPPTKCYSPSSTWHEVERNTHQSHEFRVNTPDDRRVRAIAGVYWENFKIFDNTDFQYKTVPDCTPTFNTECFLPIQPWPGAPANNPNVRNSSTAFLNDVQFGYKQLAEFASVDFDLIPKTLTFTAGTRHFKYDNSEVGGDVGSFFCKFYGGAVATNFSPCSVTNFNGFGPGGPFGTNVTRQVPNRSTPSGFRSRANLSWKVTDQALLYYTFSQGFRPGGFNRGSSSHLPDANGVPQFFTPALWQSDNLVNNEFGWKTEWFDRRIQFNGSIYQESWKNVQTGFDDPQGGLGNLGFTSNGPSYRVRGVEPSLMARVTHGLTLQASASWNSSSQTNSPYLVNNNPKSPTFGQNITSIPNPYGPLGSRLAYSPAFQGNIRVRYERAFNEYTAFWQAAGQHQAHTYSATGYVNAYDQPGFSTYDAAMGIAKGPWNVQVFGQNLTNVNTSLSTNNNQFIVTELPLRPRVLGVKAGYNFAEK